VPLKDGKVSNDARIRASLPSVKLALEKGAKVMLMSHLGRPTEGHYDDEFSLAPVAEHLGDLLGQTVRLEKDWVKKPMTMPWLSVWPSCVMCLSWMRSARHIVLRLPRMV